MKKLAMLLLTSLCLFALPISVQAGGMNVQTATTVSFDKTQEDSITEENREDYYKINLSESGRITIDMTSYMRYYCIYLYNEAEEELWRTENNEWVSTTEKRSDTHTVDLEKGTYYLKFTGYKSRGYDSYTSGNYISTGNYSFKVSYTKSGANIAEPNNSVAEAKGIAFETSYHGQIAINDREDYYKINLPESGRIAMDMTSYMEYYCIYLYNEAGEQLWYTDHNEWVSTTGKRSDVYNIDLEQGIYYLKFDGKIYDKVLSSSGETTGNYSFKISYTKSGANVAEPNNSVAEAKDIAFDKAYNGQIAMNDREDYYKINLSESGKIAIDMTSYMEYYCIYLYNEAGEQLWYTDKNEWVSTTGKRSDVHNIDLEQGIYYLKFNGYRFSTSSDSASTGNYSFKIKYTASGASVAEPNNSIAEAKVISLNQSYKGQIALNDSEDYYTMKLDKNCDIRLKVTSYMESYRIYLYNEEGKEEKLSNTKIKEWDSSIGERSDKYEVSLAAGTYYIKVEKYSNYTGNYVFEIVEKSEGTGMRNVDGKWLYYEEGEFKKDKYGFVDFNGGAFLVANGVLASEVSGLAQDPNNFDWYFLANGQIQNQYTGLAQYDGAWFYVNAGRLDTVLSGYVDYDGSKFYVAAGKIMKEVSGLAQDPNTLKWYYLAEGQAQLQYTGLAQYDGAWFYVVEGALAEDYIGNVEYDGSTFYVVNGKLVQ